MLETGELLLHYFVECVPQAFSGGRSQTGEILVLHASTRGID